AAALRIPLQSQTKTYTLEPAPAGKTLKSADGQTVFTYLTRKPDDVPLAGNSACCFHPVNTPSGERVTDIAPPDHRDHRGAFFAWGNMDFERKTGDVRADFWGWGHYAPTAGRVIQNRDVRMVNATSQSAEVAVENDWLIEGEKVLNEFTTARTRREQSANILDLIFRFTSDDKFTVDQMAFTGFVVRCRKDGQSYLSDSKGKVTLPDSNALKPETDWPAENWYSYTIALNNGKTVAAAVIDHPANPRSLWHEPRGVAFLNPCISAIQPVTIPAGQPLVLRYRTVFNDGEFLDGMLDRLAAEWRTSA
ncbi:MAG TPA: DUF6807 family protein, partial [Bryobacteraceae bacterium]|nr:DUF6807 family protein [Bryobacteraceae bacterium]